MINFWDLILPPRCVVCKVETCLPERQDFFICSNCRKDIAANRYFICPACRRRDIYGRLDKKCRKITGLAKFLGAPLLYEDERVRKVIHVFKYRRVKALAKPLAKILIEFFNTASNGRDLFRDFKRESSILKIGRLKGSPPCVERKRSLPLLAPIPMNSFKERERGFNQATEIAEILAEHYNMELNAKLLKKIKLTGNQADVKNKEDRIKNIENAFRCENPESARSKIVILVDDVYTTGATMRDCARALRAAGAREVWGVTLAR